MPWIHNSIVLVQIQFLVKQAYNSMVSLMDSAGYKDVSSFVRSAVLTKCQDIASGMVNLYADRVIDNQSYSYKPVSYLRALNNVI